MSLNTSNGLSINCARDWDSLAQAAKEKLPEIMQAMELLRVAGPMAEIIATESGRFLRSKDSAPEEHTGIRLIGLGNNTAALGLPCLDGTSLIVKISASPLTQSGEDKPSKAFIKLTKPLGYELGKADINLAETAEILHRLQPQFTPFLTQHTQKLSIGEKEVQVHVTITADLTNAGRFTLLDPKDRNFLPELQNLRNAERIHEQMNELRLFLTDLDEGRVADYRGDKCQMMDPFVVVDANGNGQVVIGDWDRATIIVIPKSPCQ